MEEEEEEVAEVEEVVAESDRRLSQIRQCQSCGWVILLPFVFGFFRARRVLFVWEFFTQRVHHIYILGVLASAELLGAVLCGICLYNLGRRKIIISNNIVLVFVIVFFLVSVNDLISFVSLIASCVCFQFFIISMIVYVVETADPLMRPVLIGFYYASEHAGYFITTILMDWPHLTTLFILMVSMGSLVLAFNAPETPYWLTLIGERDKGEEIFAYLRAGYSDMDEAFIMLNKAETDAENRQQGWRYNVLSSGIIVPVCIFQFMLMANIITVDMVDPILLELEINYPWEIGEFYDVPHAWELSLKNIIRIVLSLIGSVLFLILCRIIPFRLLYIGSVISSLLILFAFFIASYNVTLSMYMISLCHLLAHLGSFQVLQIISGEIFPSSIREVGVTFCQIETIFIFIIGEWSSLSNFLTWSQKLTIALRWFFFPVGLFFTILFMPETKGLTLTETEALGSILPFTSEIIIEEEDQIE